MINHLSQELQHWLWMKIGNKSPSVEEIAEFVEKHLSKFDQHIVSEQKNEDAKIPALLKKKPDARDAKRMRELAGIPHKGNFV